MRNCCAMVLGTLMLGCSNADVWLPSFPMSIADCNFDSHGNMKLCARGVDVSRHHEV